MPIIPIRGAGEIGVIADLLPYDVPFNAWNSARNVRFYHKTISRSSVFKKLTTTIPLNTSKPVIVTDASKDGSTGCVVTVQANGVFRQLLNGVVSIVSPTVAWNPSTTRVVSTRLGGVTYLANNDNRPVYRVDPAVQPLFQYLPGWGTNDYCNSLRAYKDFLIAINVSKGTTEYQNMVKWSDATQAGTPPANWDTASPSSLAGENVLNDARGYLIDGVTLGNSMMLYGSKETYRMTFIGAPFVFDFEKVFDDLGVPAVDCVVEVDGKHYVFGRDAIYVHDGMSKIPLSDTKVSERIFKYLDQVNAPQCFAFLNKYKSEIVFCYPSRSDECKWPLSETNGCNEGAVYNYAENTWSFIDLPGVVASGVASVPDIITWGSLAAWNTLSNSWRSFQGVSPELPILVSTGNSVRGIDASLYLFDSFVDGVTANPVETRLLWDGYVQSAVKDSDEFATNLSSTKLVRSVHPQIRNMSTSGVIRVKVGSAPNPNASIDWSLSADFNPLTDYKCDFRITGRYILVQFDIPSTVDCQLSGYDLDIDILAQR